MLRTRSITFASLVPFLVAGGLAACGGTQPQHPIATASASPVPTTAEASSGPPSPETPTTPDAPFRAHAPEPQPTPPFTPPHIETYALANGIHVMLVERHDLPVVVVHFISRRGGEDVPATKAGLASLVGTLLEAGGTTTHDPLQLSDAFAAIGAEHGTYATYDNGGGYVKVLAPHLETAVSLLAEVITHPAFAPAELERARARRLAALQQELDQPRVVAGNVALREIYGVTNPYGASLSGTEAAVRAFTRADVEHYYQTHFAPAESALVVVGDTTRASVTPLLEHTFGAWHAHAPAGHPANLQAPALPPGPRIFVVDKPGAAQSAVSVAQAGVPRTSVDYASLVVMNTILGGMFSSRINLNLREEHAYTYGAGSSFAFRHGPGPFSASGAIVTASTGPAIHEILRELDRMRTSNVTDDELALAKARIIESLPARFETVEQTAGAVGELFTFGLPMDEYSTIAHRIQAVTVADVRRVAEHDLDPEHARIVVVGDRAAIESGLRDLALGDVVYVDPHGEPVGANPPAAAEGPAHEQTTPAPSAPAPGTQHSGHHGSTTHPTAHPTHH